jgi:hypothetical protein
MAISDQSTQHIDEEIDRTAMSEVLDLGDVLELIVSRLERFLSNKCSDRGIKRFFMSERSLGTKRAPMVSSNNSKSGWEK